MSTSLNRMSAPKALVHGFVCSISKRAWHAGGSPNIGLDKFCINMFAVINTSQHFPWIRFQGQDIWWVKIVGEKQQDANILHHQRPRSVRDWHQCRSEFPPSLNVVGLHFLSPLKIGVATDPGLASEMWAEGLCASLPPGRFSELVCYFTTPFSQRGWGVRLRATAARSAWYLGEDGMGWHPPSNLSWVWSTRQDSPFVAVGH